MGFWWQFASICYFIPQILTPGRAVPRIFSPKWLDMWPPWQECFPSHFKTWKNLETVSIDRENPSTISRQIQSHWKPARNFLFQTKRLLKLLFVPMHWRLPGKHWWKFGLQGCDLATSMHDLYCSLGSAMKVTYSNLKSSLRKEVLHENCQCVLSSMYGPLI